jgi:hypothetical protein
MAVLALTSAKGAPGVTTAALALTLTWPRPVLLAECDPAGDSSLLAGYLRGSVDASHGLLGLAIAHRHGDLPAAFWPQTLPLSDGGSDSDGRERWLLPGLSDAAQAPSAAGLWEPLAGLLTGLDADGIDVVVDAGRLGATHAPVPLLRAADLVLLVLRSSLPAVSAARARLGLLRDDLGTAVPAGSGRLGLLLIGPDRPYSAGEISAALGLPVLATLAWDPSSAEVFSTGAPPPRRYDTAPLTRSCALAVAALSQHLAAQRDPRQPEHVPAAAATRSVEAASAHA